VSTSGNIDDTDPYNPLALGTYLNTFVTPKDYGAKGDGTTDDTTALNNFWLDVITNDLPHDASGTYGISNTITIGPAAQATVNSPNPLIGRMRLLALGQINELVRFRNIRYRDCRDLEIDSVGLGSTSFASRTCLINVYIQNCARTSIGRIQGKNFALANAYFGTANNDAMKVDTIVGTFIGSGRSGESLTANWSLPVNAGASGSTTQNTQITVDALPSAAIQAYETSGTGQIQVRIAGYLYLVSSIVGSNVTIYPWLDNTSVATGTGTLEWVLGGNMCTRSSDSNRIEVDVLDSADCSRGLSEAVLYGSIINNMLTSTVGTEVAIGRSLSGSCSGTQVSRYIEGGGAAPHEQVVVICPFGTSTDALFLGTAGASDLSKCWNLSAPRITAGTIQGGELGATTAAAGSFTLYNNGKFLSYNKGNLSNLPGATINLRGQTHLPRITTYLKDTATLLLNVEGSGEYNRLFGYSGSSVLFVGTGTNGAPTGNIVFTPPTGGTINGAAANATLTFSTFIGPALFSYEHTDTAQLTWIVRCIAGSPQTTTLTGDITGSGTTSIATTLAANIVTYAKFQQVAASSLVGNPTGGLANAQGITLAGGLSFSGTTLTVGALTPTSVAATGSITSSSPTAGMGYATGAGGAVTQGTSRTTTVILNTACGNITLFSAAGAATWTTFTVTNSAVGANDVIKVCQKSGTDKYMIHVTNVAAGSFQISFATTGGTTTEQPVFNFVVTKAVNA
jgi:hypothetical protein